MTCPECGKQISSTYEELMMSQYDMCVDCVKKRYPKDFEDSGEDDVEIQGPEQPCCVVCGDVLKNPNFEGHQLCIRCEADIVGVSWLPGDCWYAGVCEQCNRPDCRSRQEDYDTSYDVVSCEHCGGEILKGEAEEFNGEYYCCPECFDVEQRALATEDGLLDSNPAPYWSEYSRRYATEEEQPF